MRKRAQKWTFWDFFPLVFLVYLFFPVAEFLSKPRPAAVNVAAALCLALFLLVYTRAFLWSRQDDLRWKVGGFLLCLALFALGYPVVGMSGVTFPIYAASLIGATESVAVAGWGLFVALSAMMAPVWFGRGVSPWEVVPYMAFALVGWYANLAGYKRFVANEKLRISQIEKEKLAQLAERERIGRDLHDLLGHTLSVIVLKSELASKLAERDPARAAQEIRDVERISREALSEVRAAVRGYRGSGLSSELGRAKVALDAASIALEYDGEVLDLPRPIEATMEMVLREAVTNVVRHAGATRCKVRLGRAGGCFELEVTDNGVGGLAREGTGLTGMRERVRAVGGSLARDGKTGTRLLARFPQNVAELSVPQAVEVPA